MKVENKAAAVLGASVLLGFTVVGLGVSLYFTAKRLQVIKAQKLYLEQVALGQVMPDPAYYTQMTMDISRFKKLELASCLIPMSAGGVLGCALFGTVYGVSLAVRHSLNKSDSTII